MSADMIDADHTGRDTRLPRRTRIGAALGALALNGAVFGLLVAGLSVTLGVPLAQIGLETFDVPPPPPPAVSVPVESPHVAAIGAAAPPNRRADPRPVVAPTPAVRTLAVNPVPPVAASGDEVQAGAADFEGPGTGAGGVGIGLGSGAGSDGTGGGIAVAPKRISGSISHRDYPASASRKGVSGSVTIHLSVDVEGRVTACTVVQSSASRDLDTATCTLARKRFRYSPALDSAGAAIASIAGYRQDWWFAARK